MTTPGLLRDRLRAALTSALRDGDTVAVRAIRAALTAVANAEAVEPSDDATHHTTTAHVAGARAGAGAGEAPRHLLSEKETSAIVMSECADMRLAAEQYQERGLDDRAAHLRAQAEVLERLLAG